MLRYFLMCLVFAGLLQASEKDGMTSEFSEETVRSADFLFDTTSSDWDNVGTVIHMIDFAPELKTFIFFDVTIVEDVDIHLERKRFRKKLPHRIGYFEAYKDRCERYKKDIQSIIDFLQSDSFQYKHFDKVERELNHWTRYVHCDLSSKHPGEDYSQLLYYVKLGEKELLKKRRKWAREYVYGFKKK